MFVRARTETKDRKEKYAVNVWAGRCEMVEEVEVVEVNEESAAADVPRSSGNSETAALSLEPLEPYEPRYLKALAEEGIDLDTFLANWRHVMEEDLARLGTLHREGAFDRLHDVLHRLSGAVGLVGACSLMEALRRLSVSPRIRNDSAAINVLTARARTLVGQLESAPLPPWSTLQ